MNQHPIRTMVAVWGGCVLTYLILPFELLGRQLDVTGSLTLIAFIAAFIAGTLLIGTRKRFLPIAPCQRVDSQRTELYLMTASSFATLFFILDANNRSMFDLAAAYELRSEVSDALSKGEASISTVWFQIAFLLYPAGYVYTALHSIYARRVSVWKLVVFGMLPIGLATLAMGGRMPILYAIVVTWLALRERKKARLSHSSRATLSTRRKVLFHIIWIVVLGGLLQYFSAVFMVRADTVGGAGAMFDVAEERWGVGFSGPGSEVLFKVFGEDIAYLIFIFVWYLVQGFVMSNYLFSAYDGPPQFGMYGVDLVTAVVRRLMPEQVTEGFDSLLTFGTYGFFPSAWGALYVDFAYFAIGFCVLWGMFSALCYRRIVVQQRADWLFVGPFATAGIVFSTINTPLGFTNGFVTHVWLLVAFLSLRSRSRQLRTQSMQTCSVAS